MNKHRCYIDTDKVMMNSISFQSWKQQHIHLTTNLTLFHLELYMSGFMKMVLKNLTLTPLFHHDFTKLLGRLQAM